jgi:hypothetical protein
MELVKESEVLYQTLQKTIRKLKMRDEPRFKHLESSRVAFQSLWKHAELKTLSEQLVALGARVRSGIQMVLQL